MTELDREGEPFVCTEPDRASESAGDRRIEIGTSDAVASAGSALVDAGRGVAEWIVGPVERFAPGKALPSQALWLTDKTDQQLIVVVNPDADDKAVDRLFSFALAWQRDRDLLLVLPAAQADRVLYRLPWIATPIRVWITEPGSPPRPAVVPARDEVLAHAAEWPVHPGEDHDLGDAASKVVGLIETVEAHWALTPAHVYSYRAWHCDGLQVLRLTRTGGGVEVKAGVQYTNPKPGQAEPEIATITEPLTPAERARFEAAVSTAIANRLDDDKTYVEHRMQAALAAAEMPGLNLEARPTREYPAWRPGRAYRASHPDKGRGYIDFLGIDRDRRLHVVETKVGDDVTLVLQALDYLIWVTARDAQIRDDRRWAKAEPNTAVHMDLVLATKGSAPAIGPYTASQLEALSGDVRWRVFLVADPQAPVPEVSQLPREELFEPLPGRVAVPVQPRRFAGRVRRDVRKARP